MQQITVIVFYISWFGNHKPQQNLIFSNDFSETMSTVSQNNEHFPFFPKNSKAKSKKVSPPETLISQISFFV